MEHIRPNPIDVEEMFNKFVTYYGGEPVSPLITKCNPKDNADYYFRKQGVIAELKCLQNDPFTSDDDSGRMEIFMRKWIEKGLFEDEQNKKNLFNNLQLPIECNKDLLDAYTKSVDRVIYKANKQIRETKKQLDLPQAKGMLLLCNDGNYFLSHIHMIGVVCDLMSRKYHNSEIDGFVYFTINQVSRSGEDELDHRMWLPLYREEEDALWDFVNDLGTVFIREFYPAYTGKEDYSHFIHDDESWIGKLGKHKYLPKELAYKKKK